MPEDLKPRIFEIYFPSFSHSDSRGLIVDLTRKNFNKLVEKYCSNEYPRDHLAFYMHAPSGEYARKGDTIFFYIWDYEEIGALGHIIGKGVVNEVINIKSTDPHAWEEKDEKRTSFQSKYEMLKYCSNRLLKIKFSELEYTMCKDNYVTFEDILTQVYNIEINPGEWNNLLELFSPADIGHFYLSEEQVKIIDNKIKAGEIIIPDDMNDGLLEIPNKEAFEKHGPYFYKLITNKGKSCSLILFDIDDFRLINDISYPAGDYTLKELTKILKMECTNNGGVLFRTGGEEFHVIVPDKSLEEVAVLAERIRNVCESSSFIFNDKPIHCTLSVGVSSTEREDVKNWTQLLTTTEVAEKMAKKEGKNRVNIYRGDREKQG